MGACLDQLKPVQDRNTCIVSRPFPASFYQKVGFIFIPEIQNPVCDIEQKQASCCSWTACFLSAVVWRHRFSLRLWSPKVSQLAVCDRNTGWGTRANILLSSSYIHFASWSLLQTDRTWRGPVMLGRKGQLFTTFHYLVPAEQLQILR